MRREPTGQLSLSRRQAVCVGIMFAVCFMTSIFIISNAFSTNTNLNPSDMSGILKNPRIPKAIDANRNSPQVQQAHQLIASTLQEAFSDGASGAGCTLDEDFEKMDSFKNQRIFFAADLHNNDDVMAHWMAEFLKMVLHLPKQNIFVSIFDSASRDTTPAWVHLMKTILTLQQVPHQVISDAGDARKEGQHRIDFMAYVRNQALQPLGVFPSYQQHLKTYMGLDYTKVPVIEAASPVNMTFDRIVFLNDVFFCMRDVLRLLQHDVDLACGLDYDLNVNNKQRLSGTPQFYDTWVGRDMQGKRMKKQPPHFEQLSDREKLRQGKPIQVQCCWNGIAVLNALPFHQGMRFRHVLGEGECKSSECSHLCDDLWVNGYSRVIIDPVVKLGYKFYEWRSAVQRAHPIHQVVDLSSPVVDVSTLDRRPPKTMTCCSLERTIVDKNNRCRGKRIDDVFSWSPCLCVKDGDRNCPCDKIIY